MIPSSNMSNWSVCRLELDKAVPERVEMERNREGKARVRVSAGPETLEFEVELLQGGSHPVALVAGKVVSILAHTSRGETQICWNGARHRIRLERAADPPEPKTRQLAGNVTAPMPGRVVQVHVREGDRVETGDALLVIEAMKMQNALFSPRAGRVARIFVREGQSIERGAPLVDFEITSDVAP